VLSIVITTHRDDEGCYLTYWAVRQQDKSADIIIVADGGTEIKWERQRNTRCLRGTFGSPQASRDAGIRAALNNDVLVLESHVVVGNIEELHAWHRHNYHSAITFPYRIAEGSEQFNVYGQETDWDGNLWHKRLVYGAPTMKPYRVGQFGNSCFIVDKEWYERYGGYYLGMEGWGGEEPYICLKAWMTGRECWLVPTVWHAHYLTVGAHAYVPGLNRNLAILKYLITGEVTNGFVPTVDDQNERKLICEGPLGGDVKRLREHLKNVGALA